MREICMSGSTRERGAAVIDAIVFHSVLSSLLYRFELNGYALGLMNYGQCNT